MAQETYPVRDLKILSVLGAVVFLLLIVLPFAGGLYVWKDMERWGACRARPEQAGCASGPLWRFFDSYADVMKQAVQNEDATIGKEGGMCGGLLRLPCEPGLHCDPESAMGGARQYGTCTKDE